MIKLQFPERNLHISCFKVLIKIIKKQNKKKQKTTTTKKQTKKKQLQKKTHTHKTNKQKTSNDITECCIMGYKCNILGCISVYNNEVFTSKGSMKGNFTFSWYNFAMGWLFYAIIGI